MRYKTRINIFFILFIVNSCVNEKNNKIIKRLYIDEFPHYIMIPDKIDTNTLISKEVHSTSNYLLKFYNYDEIYLKLINNDTVSLEGVFISTGEVLEHVVEVEDFDTGNIYLDTIYSYEMRQKYGNVSE